ncbi:mitochondrial cardiolipin hydrolase [Esox lucius]|uniref:Mitochondrial cardiolipin hydrolase n=1 Tax=Esox lucius TaxID=8010 RepID=A0A3P9ANA1_ESOLU|nr:mitochondrial cardiolipin hydrolase [Esox lucius]XP_010871120.2 mitochondrial cardiolipin hydrolase [Esox lucius]XP_019905512.2 mitochondrial cardiolipin hydrolase [Esox lucius]XP_019905513.2 mitochondrial cardiolipin hydrolase [Esox lucius]
MSVVQTVKILGLGAVALTLSVEWLGWLLRRIWPHGLRNRGPLKEVFFFPTEVACTEHVFHPDSPFPCPCPLPHGVETSFSRLLGHIMSASSSLDLCVFAFTNASLSRAVLALHARGVAVRILTDMDYTLITGSQIGAVRRAGICVRCDSGAVHMHHKFAVVDGRRLITGSLNWTLTAIQSNKENVLVTDEPDLVRPFIAEFQRLWAVNAPLRRPPSPVAEKPASLAV